MGGEERSCLISKRVKKLRLGPKTGSHSRPQRLNVRKRTAVSFTCVSEERKERERDGEDEGNPSRISSSLQFTFHTLIKSNIITI